jgi:hypothetical protein
MRKKKDQQLELAVESDNYRVVEVWLEELYHRMTHLEPGWRVLSLIFKEKGMGHGRARLGLGRVGSTLGVSRHPPEDQTGLKSPARPLEPGGNSTVGGGNKCDNSEMSEGEML